MQGKVLIIDAIATNRIVLKVKLGAAFYETEQATTVSAARRLIAEHTFDLIISATTLPDGSIETLARELGGADGPCAPPIIAVASGLDRDARISALSAGVQDVMTRPLDDTLLLARVRSLIRTHAQQAEWDLHAGPQPELDVMALPKSAPPPRVTLISDGGGRAHGLVRKLRGSLGTTPAIVQIDDALAVAADGRQPDAYIFLMPDDAVLRADTLRLISAFKANKSTRHAVLVAVLPKIDATLCATLLDLGVDDLTYGPSDPEELAMRLETQVAAKRRTNALRQRVRSGLRAAVHDPLTGLHNRRYAMPMLSTLSKAEAAAGRPFAVMLADMDHFKQINDLYGHASGDAVLIETARRLLSVLRGADTVARIGGEEFLIIMPDTDANLARIAARRLCEQIGGAPYLIPGATGPVTITISIGLTVGGTQDLTGDNAPSADALLDRADKALYAAKTAGRNQVTVSRPAA